MDIYLDKIYKATGGDVLRFDSVKEAYAKLVQKRITTGNSRVFVVRDDKYFFKTDNQWGKVLLYGGALSGVQTAIRNACAHLLVISYRQENILADTKVSKFQP